MTWESIDFCVAHVEDVKIVLSFLRNTDEVKTLAAEYEVGLTTALRRLAKLSEHILEREQSQPYWSVTYPIYKSYVEESPESISIQNINTID